jgi:hypothetical protein
MTAYRLVIQEVTGAEVVTSYTKWLECVQGEGRRSAEREVYVAFSPRFERIWLDSKKRLLEYMEEKPANAALRSQYALRLYSWAKKFVKEGTQTISLEDLRRDTSAVNPFPANIEVPAPKKALSRKTQPAKLSRRGIGVSRPPVKLAPAALPDFVEPMKAQLVDSIRPGDWIYEIKFDGYRALALRAAKRPGSCPATKRISVRSSRK